MLYLENPISIIVRVVARFVSREWESRKRERRLVQDEAQLVFLQIAYRYLSNRERDIFKLDRERHLDEARSRYRSPPSTDELYSRLCGSSFQTYSFFLLTTCLRRGDQRD